MPSMHEVASLMDQAINVIAESIMKALVGIEKKKERDKMWRQLEYKEVSDKEEVTNWLDLPTDLTIAVMKTFFTEVF